MKKFLVTLLALLTVVLCAFGLSACDSKWEGTTMKNWGAVKENYGFVTETENYIYFINGVGSSDNSNKFGEPIKGALVAVDKTDFSKSSVVVPKLFVATNNEVGFFIYGDYVYYGTPCVEKNSSGDIASNEMTFMRTKLDGTDTTEYFTVNSLATEFRFVESNGVVYLVYYNTKDSTLYSYNTNTKEKITVAKTQTEETANFYSLGSYKFVDSAFNKDAVVVYTVTVYSEEYLENKASIEDYSRATENFNKVVAYKAGDSKNAMNTYGTIVLDGEEQELEYSLTLVNGSDIYYVETDKFDNSKSYTSKLTDFTFRTEILKTTDITGDALFFDKTSAYVVEDGSIIEKNLASADLMSDKKVVDDSYADCDKLLFVFDDLIYYLDCDNQIMRIEKNNENANAYRVSNGTVVTSWYNPVLIGSYLFYADNTTAGGSYINVIDLANAELVAEDTNDDEENDLFYLEGNQFIGVMVEKDKANLFIQMVNEINAEDLELTFENETYSYKPAEEARAFYNSLSKEAKSNVGDAYLDKLAEVEMAVTLSNKYNKIANIKNYSSLEQADKNAIKTEYEAIKAFRIEILTAGDIDLENVRDTYIPDQINALYALAQEIFEED